MNSFFSLGFPGDMKGIKDEVRKNYNKLYGHNGWLLEPTREGKELKVMEKVLPEADIYMVTGNHGKFASATRSLPGIKLERIALDITEDQSSTEEVTKHKLRVAYAVLCRPVICDDSGFVIPSMGEWPGNRIARVLKEKGVKYFTDLVKDHPLNSYWEMTVGFNDGIDFELFTSYSHGVLLGKLKGKEQPAAKSSLWRAFVPHGASKTLSEMTEEELKRQESDRWPKLRAFLKERNYFK